MKFLIQATTALAILTTGALQCIAQENQVSRKLSDEEYESLAQTPPMGWNSWNIFGGKIDEDKIRSIAEAMVSSGLNDVGYEYIVMDDCWQISRDEKGDIVADPEAFPHGIKALADYIHSLGLKFGLYSCAGDYTCQGRPGSNGHQYQDALKYAEWGVDYLKYDWCNNGGQNAEAAYRTMAEAIKTAGRPIILSICEWGENKPWEWGKGIGHLWRVTPDIRAVYNAKFDWGGVGVLGCIDAMEDLVEYAGPGHWNDAEMLEVGNGQMSYDENITHFSMWCMLSAPLMCGNDLRNMTSKTLEILSNKEVIALDQDKLGIQATLFMDMGDRQIWAKPLDGGEIAICFMNRSEFVWNLDYCWTDQTMYFAENINLHKKRYKIRDLWLHKDVGTTATNYKAEVPGHGVNLVRLTPVKN